MKKLAIAAATLAALAGCGGGGSSSAPPVAVQAAPATAASVPTAPVAEQAPAAAPAPTKPVMKAAAAADRPQKAPVQAKKPAKCDQCGTVQDVHLEKQKGEGGALGIVAGAAVGGLLGNQVGKGNGRKLATVGGAVAGGFAGNEVQKHVTSKEVWVTKVKMQDGTERSFEHDAKPDWKAGSAVKFDGRELVLR